MPLPALPQARRSGSSRRPASVSFRRQGGSAVGRKKKRGLEQKFVEMIGAIPVRNYNTSLGDLFIHIPARLPCASVNQFFAEIAQTLLR